MSGVNKWQDGDCCFFFHYARFTGNELFADYAMELIGEMLKQIHVNSPADYEKGIAGIGVGIDFLIRNNYLLVEDDICEDFDDLMVQAIMHDPGQDISLYNGIIGYGQYWMTRLRYQRPSIKARECLLRLIALIEEKITEISINEQSDVFCFLHDLQGISGFDNCMGLLELCRMKWGLQSMATFQKFSRLNDTVVGNIIRAYHCGRYFNDVQQDEIEMALKLIPDLDMEKAPSSSGLLNGYAGDGMIRLTAINKTDRAWMQLL